MWRNDVVHAVDDSNNGDVEGGAPDTEDQNIAGSTTSKKLSKIKNFNNRINQFTRQSFQDLHILLGEMKRENTKIHWVASKMTE